MPRRKGPPITSKTRTRVTGFVTAGNPSVPLVSSIYDDYFVEPSALDGVWCAPEGATYEFLIRYAGPMNRKTQAALADTIQRMRSAAGAAPDATEVDINEDAAHDILREFLVESVLLDWRGEGMRRRDGQPIPFSKDNARTLLRDLPPLVDWLWNRSRDRSYMNGHVEASVKN